MYLASPPFTEKHCSNNAQTNNGGVMSQKAKIEILALQKSMPFREDYEENGWKGKIVKAEYDQVFREPWYWVTVLEESVSTLGFSGINSGISIGKCKIRVIEKLN